MAIGLVSLVALLAFAPLLTRLGFYRDDWYQIWAGDTHGPGSIVTLFSIDRPFMGYTYAVTFAILRDSPLAWQVYALLLRWLGALGALWLFRRLWPRQPFATTSAALLFLVYPGFLQQPNANTFSNHLLGYAAGVLSLAATVKGLQSESKIRRVGLTALAVISALLCWLTYEYMIGLDGVRYLLIALHYRKGRDRPRARWAPDFLLASLPFLLPLGGFLIWRGFIFKAGRDTVDVAQVLGRYGPSPLGTLLDRAVELGKDFIEAVFLGWSVPSYNLLSSLPGNQLALGLVPAGLAILAFVGYARLSFGPSFVRHVLQAPLSGDSKGLFLLGAFTIFSTLTPVVLAGRDIRWSSAFDRYTLHATLGLGMFTVGLTLLALRPRAGLGLLGFLLGLSVLTHQANARHWARFWEEQRQLWWQLTWRAPDLQPGTVLLVTLPSQRYFEDYEVWGPANLIFESGIREPRIAAQVVDEETARMVRAGQIDVRSMRVLIGIPRDYHNALVVDWASPQSCIHVLEGSRLEYSSSAGSLIRSIGPYSRGDLIVTEGAAAQPPERIFGPEPDRAWCWYYQAGALARQRGEWDQAATLADEALHRGLAPTDRSEWMPFFQAYLNTGRESAARRLAGLIREDGLVRQELCGQLGSGSFRDRPTFGLAKQMLCD